jgi:hypothetical protein
MTAGRVADQARQNDGVAVVVIPDTARRALQFRAFGESRHVALDIFHPVDAIEGAGKRSIERTAHGQSGGVAQQMIDCDRVAGIIRTLPRRDRGRLVDRKLALPNQNSDQG